MALRVAIPIERIAVSALAGQPQPPYYAVIFTSRRTDADAEGYARTAARMEELARTQAGFLRIESARSADGTGITVSYWRSRETIAEWKRHAEHLVAQATGRSRWYECYQLRIARVESEYAFDQGNQSP